jgi:hypothetical protein
MTSPGECDARGNRLDQRRNVEDEVAGIGILPKFVVDPAADREVRSVDLIRGDQPRTHGAEAVERFTEEPLPSYRAVLVEGV